MKKKIKGFTLVELLAVIVILAIILVIAVPKVLNVINDSKKATIESTAKVIAGTAEKAKLQNQILGTTKEISCEDIVKINDVDYESCSIEFVGSTAKVTLKGSGKFEGLYVCGGTKVNSSATKESCSLVSLTVDLAGGIDSVDYEERYEAGTEVTLTEPTREGYSFMGWSVTGLSASIQDNKLKVGTTSTTIIAIWEEYSEDYPVLLDGPTIRDAIRTSGIREVITEFEFVDSYTPTPNDSEPMDVSYAQDGSILAYVNMTSESTAKVIVAGNGSGGILLNEDSSTMFHLLVNLKTINGMELLRWVNVENSDYMFSDSSIESVNLGTAKSIGKYAFWNCDDLTNITIPNSVTSIGERAFYFCSNLTSITIGNSVTNIGDDVFIVCDNLTNINVSVNNPTYLSIDGVLYSKDKQTLIKYPEGKTDMVFEIPNSVTSIGYSAFAYCDNLTSITIPDSVTSIGNYAFRDCIGLTSITIPNSVTSIGNNAFWSCNSLTSITIPNSVTSIGYSAFAYCDNLTSITIGNRVTSIGNSAFNGCSNLKDVYYTGKQEDWNKITIGSSNTPLTNATKHYEHVIE